MVFAAPEPDDRELDVLARIDRLRQDLRYRVAEARRWTGSLRRLSFARAVQGSNSIEGYVASLDDVVAAVDDDPPLDADEETRHALQGYRDAMTYVLQLATDTHFVLDASLLRSLHFMMVKHDLSKNPGRWRPGAVFVQDEATGRVVYEGPDADRVPDLVDEFITTTAAPLEDTHVLVRAAMAHLDLVMIHPFSDGNGRMARCLQTLVLARDQIVAPEFASIEEYLGRNTRAYYDVLAEVGQGSWHPDNDARPWIRFCLTAHLRQARTTLRRAEESEDLWSRCEHEARGHGLPPRTTSTLFDAALGFRIRNPTHRAAVRQGHGEDISEPTASRDLRQLVDAGLLVAHGEKRGRHYSAGAAIRGHTASIRAARTPRDESDPFE